MAINTIQGFNPSTTEPIDSRVTVANETARLAFATFNVYEGLVVYQEDTDELYVLNDAANPDQSSSWSTVGGGSGFPFTGSASISGSLDVVGNTYLQDAYLEQHLYHAGDTNTYLRFDNDQIRLIAANYTVFDTTGYNGTIKIGATNNPQDIYLQNDAGVGLLLQKNTGNVGIGTTSPTSLLHIKDNVNGRVHIEAGPSSGTSNSTARLIIEDNTSNAIQFLTPTGSFNSSIYFGDADNSSQGLINYNHSTDQLTLEGNSSFLIRSGGQNRLIVNSSGNIGIGTTSPSQSLHVNGGLMTQNLDGTYPRSIGLFSGDYEQVIKYSGNALNIQHSSNDDTLGAGGSNVIVNLSPYGSSNRTSTLGFGNKNKQKFIHTSADGLLTLQNSGSVDLVSIDFTGNVGIGTTSPTSKLHVEGTSKFVGQGTYPMQMENNISSGNAEMSLWTVTDVYAATKNLSLVATPINNQPVWYFQAAGAGWQNITLQRYGGQVGIRTLEPTANLTVQGHGTTTGKTFLAQDSNASALFTILDNGNVGIGTSSPSEKLHVVGDATITGSLNMSGSINLTGDRREINILGDDGQVALKLNDTNAGATDTGKIGWYINGNLYGSITANGGSPTDGLIIRSETNRAITFKTNGNLDRMIIQQDGNVGIGTTSPSAKLHVFSDTHSDFLDNGILLDVSSSDEGEPAVAFRNQSDMGSNYWITGINNGGQNLDFAYGTAFTSANTNVRFTSDGKVGIGTTSPSTTLHVSGSGGGSDVLLVEPAGAPTVSLKSNSTLTDYSGLSVGNKYLLLTKNSGAIFQNIQGGLRFANGLAAKSVITEAGYLGIGHNSINTVNYPLDVSGSANISGDLVINDTISTPNNTSLRLEPSGSTGQIFFGSPSDGTILYHYSRANNGDNAYYNFDGGYYVITTNDNYGIKLNNDVLVSGDLTVDGKVTAQEFHTEFVSASIIYQSGSTKFGDTLDDTHSFTGSLQASGGFAWVPDRQQLQVAPTFTTGQGDFKGIVLGNDAEIRSNSNSASRIAGFRLYNPNTSTGQLELYRAGTVTTQLTSGDQTSNNVSFVTYGNFGLGTSTPDKGKLVISSRAIKSSSTALLYVTGSTSETYNLARFVSDETDRVVITNSGSVGIGTTSPTSRLQVKGSGTTDSTTSLRVENANASASLVVRDDGRVLVDEYIYPADGTTNSRFRVSHSQGTFMYYSTGNLRVNPSLVYSSTTYGTVFAVSNSTGNFGLGTTSATAKMHIVGDSTLSTDTSLLVENSTGGDLLKVDNNGTITVQPYRQIQTSSSGANAITIQSPTHQQFKAWTNAFRWLTQNGTIMELTNDGKLGIGTTNPTGSLQLLTPSTTTLRVDSTNSFGNGIKLETTGLNQNLTSDGGTFSIIGKYSTVWEMNTNLIIPQQYFYGGYVNFRKRGTTTNLAQIGLEDNSNTYFNTGNIGIGTNSPARLLHLSASDTAVNPNLLIEQAGTGNASIGFKLAGSTEFNMGIDNADGNKFKIHRNYPVGGSGNVLTIDGSNNVGIGTTSPAATLDIRGTISQTVDAQTNQYPLSFYNSHSGTDYYLLRQRVVNTGNQVRTGLGITGVPDAAFVLGSQTDQILKFATSGRIRNVQEILGSSTLEIIGTDIRLGDGNNSQGSGIANIVGASGKVPLLVQEESGSSQTKFIRFLDSGSTEVMGITTDGGFIASTDTLIKRFSYSHAYDGSNVSDGQGVGISLITDDEGNNLRDIAYIDAVQDDISEDESSLRFSVGETTPTEVMRLQSDGNIGIGNSSPTHTVEIGTDGGGEKILKMHSDTASSYFEIQSLGNVARLLATNNTNLLLQSDGTGGYITFNANSAERMRIDSSGRLLINSTSTSFSDKLYINNSAYATGGWRVGTSSTYVGKLYNASGILTLESDSTRDIQFGSVTNGTAIFIEGSNSKVGIGTTSPSQKLHVSGNIETENYYPTIYVNHQGTILGGVRADATTKLEFKTLTTAPISFQVNSNQKMLITDSGNVGIGTNSPTEKLDVNGTVKATAFVETSARKFKENIEPISSALETVTQLQGVTFNRIGEEKVEYGFIADEVKDIIPELVSHDANGEVHGVHYARTVAVLTEAIKELDNKVKAQDLFIKDLVARIEKLENK